MYWLVTFVTHNSRVSDRMRRFGVRPGIATILQPDDQVLIARAFAQTSQSHSIAILSFNVLPDHVHMIIGAASEKRLAEHVRRFKGYSAYIYRKKYHLLGTAHLWAEKFNRRPTGDHDTLRRMIHYVSENPVKHATRWGHEIETVWLARIRPIVDTACSPYAAGLSEIL